MGKKKNEFIRATRNKSVDEALIKGMSILDFTKHGSLEDEEEDVSDLTEEQKEEYVSIKRHLLKHLADGLKNAGVTRPVENFGRNYPLNVLIDADARHLAKKAVEVLDDEEMLFAAIKTFCEMFAPFILFKVRLYCKKMGKKSVLLSEDEEEELSKQITTPLLKAGLTELLIGQQVPEIFGEVKGTLTPEDFDKRSTDYMNFEKKWYKPNRKKVKAFVSADTDSMFERINNALNREVENDLIDLLMYKEFAQNLSAEEARLLQMWRDGMKQNAIAKELGCAQGTISKRMGAILNRAEEFVNG